VLIGDSSGVLWMCEVWESNADIDDDSHSDVGAIGKAPSVGRVAYIRVTPSVSPSSAAAAVLSMHQCPPPLAAVHCRECAVDIASAAALAANDANSNGADFAAASAALRRKHSGFMSFLKNTPFSSSSSSSPLFGSSSSSSASAPSPLSLAASSDAQSAAALSRVGGFVAASSAASAQLQIYDATAFVFVCDANGGVTALRCADFLRRFFL
jgi:hypothetical protein